MSQIALIKMKLGKGSATLADISIEVAPNLDFLKELARRALGLETARQNAKARSIDVEDYADHDLVFGPASTRLRIHKVCIDCSSGYYHTPYFVLETKAGDKVFGRLSTIELAAIQGTPSPQSAIEMEGV